MERETSGKFCRRIPALLLVMMLLFISVTPVWADTDAAQTTETAAAQTETETEDDTIGSKAIAAAICIGAVGAAGAIAMGMAVSKAEDGMSRQPEAQGPIRTTMMLGLVFIETAIIYALIVTILIIFVL